MSLDNARSRMAGAPHRSSVVDLIKDFIVRNELRPGQPLPTESELGAELEVSRSSIREAIRTLAAFDIVEVRHGHGSYVGRLSLRALVESLAFRSLLGDSDDRKVVLDLVEIRQMLEVGMAEQIIDGVRGGLADRLTALTDAMSALAAQGRDHLEEDREFHLMLMTPLGNDLVGQFTGAFWDVHSIVLPGIDADVPTREATVQAHRDIVEAAVAGDVDLLSAAIVRHYDPIRARIGARLG